MLPVLNTPRLTLHPATEDHLDELWILWDQTQVRRYLFDDTRVTRERATELLEHCLALVSDGLGLWSVSLDDTRDIIGCAALMPVTTAAAYNTDLAGLVEPLIALTPSLWHQGYATEALAAVLTYGFDVYGLAQLAAVNDVPNEASARLLERLGFVATGERAGPRYRLRSYLLRREAFLMRGSVGLGGS